MKLPEGPPGYEILAELGQGTTGVVYLARQEARKRLVALKILRVGPDFECAEQFAMFCCEARVMAYLADANVPVMYEISQFQDTYYHVREFVEGWTLQEAVTIGTLNLPDGAKVL